MRSRMRRTHNFSNAAIIVQLDVSVARYARIKTDLRRFPKLSAIRGMRSNSKVCGTGEMVRLTSAAMALTGSLLSASHAEVRPTSGPQPVSAASAALITNCYKMAQRIVPRVRGRSAWVVRHADHCVRSGGSL